VGDGADRAPDQPLDLDGAAALPAARGFALRPVAGRGGQERVLGGQPAASFAVEPAGDALLDRRRAEHLRLSLAEEHGPVRLLEVVRQKLELPELVGPATVRASLAAAHAAASAASSTCSTAAI